MSVYDKVFKRALDVACASTAIVVLSPLLVLAALAIRLEDRGPAVFRQMRVGRRGAPFTLMKFRSMPVGTPEVPSAQSTQLKVTKVGAFIRRANIDELPQLFNIVRGDMSVVGPRPALPSQHSLVSARKALHVDELRPGLTGLAQVNSYDGMSEREKIEWERQYASKVTFFGDIMIILRTVGYLLSRPPVY